MPHSALAQKLLSKWHSIQQSAVPKRHCFVGFDGFTDEIVEVVDVRQDIHNYTPLISIADLGHRLLAAAGKSCNLELILKRKKLGGNAPILVNALLEGHHDIVFAGSIGTAQQIEPLFQEMAKRCVKVYPLCPSGHSDAIEFQDGKVILGKLDNLTSINWNNLIQQIPIKTFAPLLENSDLFVCANWTMLPAMTDIWKRILQEITPLFSKKFYQKKHWLFVDIADPAKRSDRDLKEALDVLRGLSKIYHTILGLNEAEAIRIAKVLGLKKAGHTIEEIQNLAKDLQEQSGLQQIVIHPTLFAVSCTNGAVNVVKGPNIGNPVLKTGGGDNFNAGFLNGLLYDFTQEEMLLSGVATSGYYVAHGKSPTMPELAAFLEQWSQI